MTTIMHHVAIMNPAWKLIPKILSGEKTIESRWYQTRHAPWNQIQKNDTIFFKDSGKPITAQADVSEVLQFTFQDLAGVRYVLNQYGKEICLVNPDPTTWGKLPKYCILIRLKNPQILKQPFAIHKAGYGIGCAWMVVEDINDIVIPA